jgi:hypothetical protein
MTRFTLCVLLTLSTLSTATFSTDAQGKREMSQTQQSEVSARGADIPPPPLRVSRIKNSHVNYMPNSRIRKYPVPAVVFQREGLASPEDRGEIFENIIYPAINKSDKPIAAVVAEFYRDRPEIGVTLMWHASSSFGDSQYFSTLISRDKTGHFDKGSYLRLFHEEDQ